MHKDIDTDVDCRYRYMFWNVIEKVKTKSATKILVFIF